MSTLKQTERDKLIELSTNVKNLCVKFDNEIKARRAWETKTDITSKENGAAHLQIVTSLGKMEVRVTKDLNNKIDKSAGYWLIGVLVGIFGFVIGLLHYT